MQEGLVEKTEQYIREKKLIAAGDRVLAGVSGGADSVCLLHILRELAGGLSFFVGAFHVNHGIRGAQADADEAFVRELCAAYKVPFYAVRVNVPEYAKERGIGLEEAGRQVRYKEAARLCEEHGYTKLALAHHQRDVAETFLFHLFRGSSVGGLASIPPKRGTVIRPLLFCEKNEILDYLRLHGENYCTDMTNENQDYARNRIRHAILPEAEQINKGAVRHIAQAAGELFELREYLEAEAEALIRCAVWTKDGVSLSVDVLRGAPRVLRSKAVYQLLSRLSGSTRDLTRVHVEQVLSLLDKQSGRSTVLPYGIVAERSFDHLIFTRTGKKSDTAAGSTGNTELLVEVPGEYPTGREGVTLRFRCFPYQKNEEIPKNEYTKWFDYGKINGALKLRTRREGDVLGMLSGRKSLKSVFTEKKVDKGLRDLLLLLADDTQVLWVPGIKACDTCRIDEATETVLEVQMYKGGKHEG